MEIRFIFKNRTFDKKQVMATLDLSKLNDKEKMKLISKIHESMDSIELSDSVKKVLDERLKRIEDGTTKFFTRDQLKNRIDQLK